MHHGEIYFHRREWGSGLSWSSEEAPGRYGWFSALSYHGYDRDQFEKAVAKALKANEAKSLMPECNLEIVPGKGMPELSIIDYLIWAVQRKLLTGESRYFNAVEDKFETITNLFEEQFYQKS